MTTMQEFDALPATEKDRVYAELSRRVCESIEKEANYWYWESFYRQFPESRPKAEASQ